MKICVIRCVIVAALLLPWLAEANEKLPPAPTRVRPFPPASSSAGTPVPAAPRLSPEKIAEICTPSDAYLGKAEFSGASFSGRVVDDEGKPIRDALVVVLWSAQRPDISRKPSPRGMVHAAESVTDAEGRFIFPAWGPSRINIYPGEDKSIWHERADSLVREDPFVLIYKNGYFVLSHDPEGEGGPIRRLRPGAVARSKLDGREFRLNRDPYASDPLSGTKGSATAFIGKIVYWFSNTENCVTARFTRSLAVALAWQQARVAKTGDMHGGNGYIESLLVCNDFWVAHGCPSMLSHLEVKK